MSFEDTQIKYTMKGMKAKVYMEKVLGLLLSGTGVVDSGSNNNGVDSKLAIDLVFL